MQWNPRRRRKDGPSHSASRRPTRKDLGIPCREWLGEVYHQGPRILGTIWVVNRKRREYRPLLEFY